MFIQFLGYWNCRHATGSAKNGKEGHGPQELVNIRVRKFFLRAKSNQLKRWNRCQNISHVIASCFGDVLATTAQRMWYLSLLGGDDWRNTNSSYWCTVKLTGVTVSCIRQVWKPQSGMADQTQAQRYAMYCAWPRPQGSSPHYRSKALCTPKDCRVTQNQICLHGMPSWWPIRLKLYSAWFVTLCDILSGIAFHIFF